MVCHCHVSDVSFGDLRRSGNIRDHGSNQQIRQRGVRNHAGQYDGPNHLRESWPKLKFAVETAQLSRAQRTDHLAHALYFGQRRVAQTASRRGSDACVGATGERTLASYIVKPIHDQMQRALRER